MNDPDARQSWEEMLADLGFGQDTKPSAPPAPPAPPPAPPEPTGDATEEAPRSRKKRTKAEPAEAESKKPRSRKSRPDEEASPASTPENAAGVADEEQPESVTAEPVVLELPGAVVVEEVIEVEETAEGDGATEKPEDGKPESESERKKRRRRRRGRGRNKGEQQEIIARTPEASEGDEEGDREDEVVGETGGDAPPAAVDEDDEFEDLTDLQVPTWHELVASLYRPQDR